LIDYNCPTQELRLALALAGLALAVGTAVASVRATALGILGDIGGCEHIG